ncbi:uncharacterized protein LOC129294314 [Prosopis cineraria]|uniref:uncharacterized protein LOC129294314 n=1 Tax=Prosopis cineraria TaxID=364024 RepID=UPI00240F6A9E|nr:uncharacterized protein LOC129294314 [Prosopis cineraria]
MAAFVTNQSLLASSPCSASLLSNPLKTLEPNIRLLSLPYPSLRRPIYACRPMLGFSSQYVPFSYGSRGIIFKPYFAAGDSSPNTDDENENTQNDMKLTDNEEDKVSPSSFMALIEAYKEASLDGDKITASRVEMRIKLMANQKNELIQLVSTLSAEKVASREKCLRWQADFDNFRKRFEKEKHNIQSNAQVEVIEKLLLMVDSFDRTKQQIKPATDKEKKIDASYQGIYKQFVEILRSHHVAVVATVGKHFDPLVHEAIAREESQECKEGIIIQESRRGFLLRDRLLRPALVKVSSGPGNKKATVTPDNSKEQPAAAAGIDDR